MNSLVLLAFLIFPSDSKADTNTELARLRPIVAQHLRMPEKVIQDSTAVSFPKEFPSLLVTLAKAYERLGLPAFAPELAYTISRSKPICASRFYISLSCVAEAVSDSREYF